MVWIVARRDSLPASLLAIDEVHVAGDGAAALRARVCAASLRGAAARRAADVAQALADRIEHLEARVDGLEAGREAFLSLVHHDMRSPLAVVVGHCQLIEEDLVPASQFKRGIEIVRRQAERITALADGTAEAVRRAEDAALPRVSTSIEAAVRDVLAVHGAATDGRRLRASGRDARVVAAPDLLRDVIARHLQACVRLSAADAVLGVGWGEVGDRVVVELRYSTGARVSPGPTDGAQTHATPLPAALEAASDGLTSLDGELRVRPAPRGGARFELCFPRGAAPTSLVSSASRSLDVATGLRTGEALVSRRAIADDRTALVTVEVLHSHELLRAVGWTGAAWVRRWVAAQVARSAGMGTALRLGADLFAIYLPHADPDTAKQLVTALRAALDGARPRAGTLRVRLRVDVRLHAGADALAHIVRPTCASGGSQQEEAPVGA